MVLVDGNIDFLLSQCLPYVQRQEVVGILAHTESLPVIHQWLSVHHLWCPGSVHLYSCGSKSDLLTVARELYSTLRKFDETDVQIIFSEIVEETGVGEAVMNRLNKAAGGRIITQQK